ncbi:hypothetical protein F3J16_36440, partial [Burkholderia sp. Ap-962]|nr:hypothetical protein [Burkholderia sp. Ap-962]
MSARADPRARALVSSADRHRHRAAPRVAYPERAAARSAPCPAPACTAPPHGSTRTLIHGQPIMTATTTPSLSIQPLLAELGVDLAAWRG